MESLLTYRNDAADSHLINAFWYLVTGNMKSGDRTKPAENNNEGFVQRWNRMKKSQTIEMYGRIHSDTRSTLSPKLR